MTSKTMSAATDAIAKAHQTIKAAVEELQGKIDAQQQIVNQCSSEIGRLLGLPISLADFSGYLKQEIERQGQGWVGVGKDILAVRSDESKQNKLSWEKFESGHSSFFTDRTMPGAYGSRDAFGMMCYFLPDQVHARLMAQYEETCGTKWGNEEHPSISERRALIGPLREQRDAAKQKFDELTAELSTVSGGLVISVEAPDGSVTMPPLKGQRLHNPDLDTSA